MRVGKEDELEENLGESVYDKKDKVDMDWLLQTVSVAEKERNSSIAKEKRNTTRETETLNHHNQEEKRYQRRPERLDFVHYN